MGRLDREVRGIVGEVEKERRFFLRFRTDVVDSPLAKEIRRMTFRLDDLRVLSHPVHTTSQMRVVVIHHVGQEPVKEIESSIIGNVR